MARAVIEVAIALVFRHSRLLVTRRKAEAHLGGLWEFPGGKLQPGESPEQAAVRELDEEVNLQVRPVGRGETIRYDYPERSVRLFPVYCSLEPDACGATALQLREVADARWVSREELGGLSFPEANRPLIAELLSREWPVLASSVG